MKFKAGDKVKVIQIIRNTYKAVLESVGNTYTIKAVMSIECKYPYLLSNNHHYAEDELELVEENKGKKLLKNTTNKTIAKDTLVTVKGKPAIEQALHLDSGKLPVQDVPVEAIEAIAARLQLGQAKGYPRNNWRKGMNYSSLMGSILRHLQAFQKGEKIDIDDKTGIEQPHLYGAICCLAFLVTYEAHPEKYSHFDDLPKLEK